MHHKLLINAALGVIATTGTSSEDLCEAARSVVEACYRLPMILFPRDPGDLSTADNIPLTATVEGKGDVSMDGDCPEPVRTVLLAETKQTIGLFRLWKSDEGDIRFHYYEDDSPVYVINFCPESHEIHTVGVIEDDEPRRIFWRFHIARTSIRFMYNPHAKESPKIGFWITYG